MRRFVVFLAIFVFWVSCAEAQEVKIKLPTIARLLGLGPKTSISVSNQTQFYAKLIVLCDEVCVIKPNGSVYDRYSFDFDQTELPIFTLMYSDSACANFSGVAHKVLRMRLGEIENWNIKNSDVKCVDGRRYPGSFFPPFLAVGKSSKVDFPRIRLKSTTVVQFVNNTPFDLNIRIDGRDFYFLRPTEFCCFESNRGGGSGRHQAEFIFSQNGWVIGNREDYFSGGNNPRGVQFILTPDKIRKQ